jgi:hypothetical protein
MGRSLLRKIPLLCQNCNGMAYLFRQNVTRSGDHTAEPGENCPR